jgi:hypothetical protein
MTFDEWRILVKGLKSVYTSDRFLPDADAIKLWFKLLQDLEYTAVNAAAQKYILTNKFPPTVADIRESATELQHGKCPDWGEAWEETCKAIKRFGFYRPKEALESLRPLTRETVNWLGFSNLCMSENPTADRANFRTCYEIVAKREQQAQILPLPLQETIKQLADGMATNDKSGQSLLADNERK